MAIKASITITISKYRDCDSITRYFKLQASTAAAPAIPTTLIPSSSDWSTTEPNYTSGSTNTLYYTDKYVFSDGTFQYTDDGNGKAIKSSSYEAAKEAYNKAQNAQNIANNVNNNLNNMDFSDKNLLFNYQKMRQDNSQWDRTNIIFDTTDLPEDDELNFKMKGIARTSYYIPFNKSHSYKFEAWFKAVDTHKTNVNLFYPSIEAYDADKLWIEFKHSLQRPNTITTTVQDINPGDTVIYADDLTNWDVSANHPYYYVGIYNYKSSQGIEYNKYTRNICKFGDYGQPKDNINKTNNTITLQEPYSGPVIPSGTNIAQNGEGSTYIYPFAGISYSSVAEWTKLIMSDTKLDIDFDVRLESTSYIRYLNFNQYFWLYNPKLYDVTSEEELKNIAVGVNDSLDKIYDLQIDQKGIRSIVGDVSNKQNVLESNYEKLLGEFSTYKENEDSFEWNLYKTLYGDTSTQDDPRNFNDKRLTFKSMRLDDTGLSIIDSESPFSSTLNTESVQFKYYDDVVGEYNKDGASITNLKVTETSILGHLRINKVIESYGAQNPRKRTRIYWIGGQ